MATKFDPKDPDSQGPYPKPPRSPTAPRPRSQTSPGKSGSDLAVTAPEASRSLPLVYGTAKVQGTIIEQYSSVVFAGTLKAPAWQISFPYSVGDRVTANSNTYVCVTSGISSGSGTGPSGTGSGIVDGNTSFGPFHVDTAVRWNFVEVGTDISWRPSTAYTVNLMTTRVLANGNFYVCTTSGTSAATGTGPSGTATSGITDGTCVWGYVPAGWRTVFAAAFCEGQIFGAKAGWSDGYTNTKDFNLIANEGISLQLGTPTGGGRPSWFPTPDATFADLYSDVAVLYLASLGTADRKTTNISLEIINGTGVSDTAPDMNPADITIEMLTDARKGAAWLSARVDTAGTLAVGVASSYRNYCTANGLLLSWVIDTQATAMELLGHLLAATNTDAVWTGGVLKFYPRSDVAITANGATYTPNLTPVFNLTQDDIVGMVEVPSRRSGTRSFNDYPVEYTDRAGSYVRRVVDDPDMADVDKRGMLRAATVALPQILAPATAIMLSRIFAQRSLKVRNTYKFRLPHRFMLLDPCDIVTLTDSISGLSAQPVRITAIEEDQAASGSFLVEAEDFPGAVHAAAQYTPQAGDGFSPMRGTATGQAVLLPANTPGQTVTDSSSTRGAAVHNMWPNAGSEENPPGGALLTSPEWAARVNAGTGAFAGNWVRELSSAANAGFIFLGDKPLGTTAITAGTILGLKVRATPGDSFLVEAQCRATSVVSGGVSPQTLVSIGWYAYDSTENVITTSGVRDNFDFSGLGVPTAYQSMTTRTGAATACPAGTVGVWFVFRIFGSGSGSTGTATAQFDAISIYRVSEASSDAAQVGTALTVAAGGNVFTDIPGTSQSFTPNTASRKIKVSLALSAFGVTAVNGIFGVRIVFGGTPTQAGTTYSFVLNTINQHQSLAFLWSFAAATFGPVGTAVTVKAQVRSATGQPTGLSMDANDTSAMIIEEIG